MAPTEVKQRIEHETARRARIGVPVMASGFLYFLGAIVVTASLKTSPTVGILQGLAPALNGQANPSRSPKASEVIFESHHSFGLIAGAVVSSIAILILVMGLIFLLDSTIFRRPQTPRPARPLVIFGGTVVVVLGIVNEIYLAVRRHQFATGHDFSVHAVNAINHNGLYNVLAIITPLAGLALVAGMIITMVGSVRVGLLPRWMGIVGGVGAVSLLLPAITLDLIPAFWMAALGLLFAGRWPGGDPPAWAAGEARPWPSQAQVRAERGGGQPPSAKGRSQKTAIAEAQAAPAAKPTTQSGKRRRRKGGARH
jgi:hypothetical protein